MLEIGSLISQAIYRFLEVLFEIEAQNMNTEQSVGCRLSNYG